MAAGNFRACLSVTLKWEGGWSDNPRDPGGPTMCGVTLRTLSQYLGRPATKSELRAISSDVLAEVYSKLYWSPIGGDSLPAGVDMMLFDDAVNSGDGRAHVWALATANLPPFARIYKLDSLRRSFWRKLASFVTFGKGWFAREDGVFATAKKMYAAGST